MQCTNKLKQLGLALHNYHDTNDSIHARCCGPYGKRLASNNDRYSGFIGLLPYLEQQSLYARFCSDEMLNGHSLASGAASLHPAHWQNMPETFLSCVSVSALLCPSDSYGTAKGPNDAGRINYRMCVGDIAANQNDGPVRGLFGHGYGSAAGYRGWYSFAAVTDGLSNTVAYSERIGGANPRSIREGVAAHPAAFPTSGSGLIKPSTCNALRDASNQYNPTVVSDANLSVAAQITGKTFTDGVTFNCGFSAVLPPNSPSCSSTTTNGNPVMITPSSFHTGGVNATLCDGSVHFISDTIDAGTNTTNSPHANPSKESPYGVWGFLATKALGDNAHL